MGDREKTRSHLMNRLDGLRKMLNERQEAIGEF